MQFIITNFIFLLHILCSFATRKFEREENKLCYTTDTKLVAHVTYLAKYIVDFEGAKFNVNNLKGFDLKSYGGSLKHTGDGIFHKFYVFSTEFDLNGTEIKRGEIIEFSFDIDGENEKSVQLQVVLTESNILK
jgi:hypothetical protein